MRGRVLTTGAGGGAGTTGTSATGVFAEASSPGALPGGVAVNTVSTAGALVGGAEAQALSSTTMALTQTHCKLCFMKTLSLCENEKQQIVQDKGNPMKRPVPWAAKVLALLDTGNHSAALAQIKVAPSVRDVQALQLLLGRHAKWKKNALLTQAVDDQMATLSHPRLHRSP